MPNFPDYVHGHGMFYLMHSIVFVRVCSFTILPACFKECPEVDSVLALMGVGLSFSSMYPNSVDVSRILKVSVKIIVASCY